MATLSAERVLTCKGRAPNTEARPLEIVCLDGDNQVLTPTQLQQQYLTTRVGVRPAFAMIAAEFVFGGGMA